MGCRIVLPATRPEDDSQNLPNLQHDLLIWAEELFGERDQSWHILPPMFVTGYPHTFYVDHSSYNLVMIKLSENAREKWTFALYQLAHEVIHLLNPRPGCKANNLEEGVACAFSYYVQRRCGIAMPRFVNHNHPAYEYVHDFVKQLPKGDIAGAKRIRQEMPTGRSFSGVSSVNLKRIFPGIRTELAEELTRKFDRDRSDYPHS